MRGGPSLGANRVINGVHVVPIGMANAVLIEGDDGLRLAMANGTSTLVNREALLVVV
jgi:hypothetical protein